MSVGPQNGAIAARPQARQRLPTRQISDLWAPQVFRSLPIGGPLSSPRHLVRRNLAIFSPGGGAGFYPHRPLRLPRDEGRRWATFFGALGLRRAFHPDRPRSVCRDSGRTVSRGMSRILLAPPDQRGHPRLPGLSRPCNIASCRRSHDITTDPIDPPRFEALARLRSGEGANSAVYAGLYFGRAAAAGLS